MTRFSFQSLFVLFTWILYGLISAFALVDNLAPVTKSGLKSVNVVQVDSCLVIYGVNPTTNSLVVDMYDPQLRLVHQFSEKIAGFTAHAVSLQYSSGLRFEFVVSDMKNKSRKFIFLDKELKATYQSESTVKPAVISSASEITLDSFRTDEFAWEIKTVNQDLSFGKMQALTSLYQYGIKLNPSFPLHELNRSIVLDSAVVEYAKVILVRENKVYVYVNQSTQNGNQFVCCYSAIDGRLVYRTKLVASFNDTQLEDPNWDIDRFSKSDATLISNCFWDDRTNRLIIGGTWLLNMGKQSGTFLMQLDEKGVITASCVDYDYWYSSPIYGGQHSGNGAFSRNSFTYYRIKNMGYQGDGSFSFIAEAYAKVNLFKPAGKEPEARYQQDEYHHYFAIEAYYFYIQPGSIKRKCDGFPVRVAPWAANHHLDSIYGFQAGKSRMFDRQLISDVNRLCDGFLNDGYFSAVIRGPGKNATKVLTREQVLFDGTNVSSAYFSKQVYSANNSNRIAFVEPYPIHEQSFAERNDFYAIDAKRLYRVTLKSDSYSLKVIAW